MIDSLPDMNVVAEARDGRTTVELAREHSPHIVVMDIDMPELNGVEATRQIVAESPEIKVIALSMHSDVRYVFRHVACGAWLMWIQPKI